MTHEILSIYGYYGAYHRWRRSGGDANAMNKESHLHLHGAAAAAAGAAGAANKQQIES